MNDRAVNSIQDIRNQNIREKEVAVEEAQKATVAVEAARHEKGQRAQVESKLKLCKADLGHQKLMYERKIDVLKENQVREVQLACCEPVETVLKLSWTDCWDPETRERQGRC